MQFHGDSCLESCFLETFFPGSILAENELILAETKSWVLTYGFNLTPEAVSLYFVMEHSSNHPFLMILHDPNRSLAYSN